MVLQAVHGAASGFFAPASAGFIPEVAPRDLLQEANALRGIAMSGGRIVGAALGGAIVALASPEWAFAIDAATFAISARLLSTVAAPGVARAAKSTFIEDLAAGWNVVRSQQWLWSFLVALGLANLFLAPFSVLGPVIARDELGGVGAWATIQVGLGVGAVLGGVVALHLRPRRPLVLIAIGLMAEAAPLGCLALTLPTLVITAAQVIGTGGFMLSLSLWETVLANASTLTRSRASVPMTGSSVSPRHRSGTRSWGRLPTCSAGR